MRSLVQGGTERSENRQKFGPLDSCKQHYAEEPLCKVGSLKRRGFLGTQDRRSFSYSGCLREA